LVVLHARAFGYCLPFAAVGCANVRHNIFPKNRDWVLATSKFYGLFFKSLTNAEVNLTSHALKVMLVDGTYTPNQDTHRYKSDITGEISGTGYVAGGTTVGSVTVSYDASLNKLSFDAADATWPASTISARYAILYDSSPASDATRPLIGYVDFGGVISSTAAQFAVVWDSAGVGYVTVA
jgi:hypothetical protein